MTIGELIDAKTIKDQQGVSELLSSLYPTSFQDDEILDKLLGHFAIRGTTPGFLRRMTVSEVEAILREDLRCFESSRQAPMIKSKISLGILCSEEFEDAIGLVSLPESLRKVLARNPAVLAIRNAIDDGEITELETAVFANSIVGLFQEGRRLPNELALAALAVAMEECTRPVADELLQDLSGLRLAEMSFCTRVARLCLERRTAKRHE